MSMVSLNLIAWFLYLGIDHVPGPQLVVIVTVFSRHVLPLMCLVLTLDNLRETVLRAPMAW